MSGPVNAIMGDSFGTDLPQAVPDQEGIKEEKRKAQFTKSKEYQQLKERFQARIEFYQTFLPDGRPLTAVNQEELAKNWIIANALIGEFNLIFDEYESVREVVEESNGK